MASEARTSSRYRDIATKLQRGMPRELAKALQVKAGSPALTVVRRYYGAHEELFEVTVTTHPEGRYTYSMDMQRSLRPRV
jgi:DNA-binding GntR family transcriptional regulator